MTTIQIRMGQQEQKEAASMTNWMWEVRLKFLAGVAKRIQEKGQGLGAGVGVGWVMSHAILVPGCWGNTEKRKNHRFLQSQCLQPGRTQSHLFCSKLT